jgi:gamma-glutamylcyclotransferase
VGVLFKVKASEKQTLDKRKGLGHGYEEKDVDILTKKGNRKAKTYYAADKDWTLKPYHWYKAFVVAGRLKTIFLMTTQRY